MIDRLSHRPQARTALSGGPASEVPRQAGFTAAFLLAGLLGRATIIDGQALSLVWPAAGVAVVWFVTVSRQGTGPLVRASVLLAGATMAVNLLTGASWRLALAFVTANLVQALVATRLSSPSWPPGTTSTVPPGTRPLTSVRGVLQLTAVAGTAAAAGAGVGWVAITWWVPGVPLGVAPIGLWWGRNVTGILVVVAAASLLVDAWTERHREAAPVGRGRSHTATALLFAATAAAYSLGFTLVDRDLTFPLLALTIWAGLTCGGLLTVLHAIASAALAVGWTLAGEGPFSSAGSPAVVAAEVQLYVGFITVLGLLLSAAQSEIRAVLARARRAEAEAFSRAALLTAVTEAMSDGVVVVDGHGAVVTANPAAAHLLSDELGGVSRRGQVRLLRPDGTPLEAEDFPSVRALREGQTPAQDVMLLRTDGVPRILSARATRLNVDEPGAEQDRVAVVYTDVTADRAERDRLAGFAATVAHDLRSPLTVAQGWVDLCLMDVAEADGTEVDRLGPQLERAAAGLDTMGRLIDDLLSHASAQGEGLALERVDLRRLVTEVVTSQGLEHVVTTTPLPPVRMDPVLARQLVANVVTNAHKYRHPSRPLRIDVAAEEREGLVVLRIDDNGVGIPESERLAVFQRFYRVQRDQHAPTGTGLGLALCQTIVERHGGSIAALPGPGGEGTRIEVELPACRGVPALARAR